MRAGIQSTSQTTIPMKKVLVVEDALADRRLMAALLNQADVEVFCVDSAESALIWLANQRPDLIVLDVIMPGLSGLELCRQLRADSSYKNLPIIFCSSQDQGFDRFWAISQGGNAYITKPYAPCELIEIVRHYLFKEI